MKKVSILLVFVFIAIFSWAQDQIYVETHDGGYYEFDYVDIMQDGEYTDAFDDVFIADFNETWSISLEDLTYIYFYEDKGKIWGDFAMVWDEYVSGRFPRNIMLIGGYWDGGEEIELPIHDVGYLEVYRFDDYSEYDEYYDESWDAPPYMELSEDELTYITEYMTVFFETFVGMFEDLAGADTKDDVIATANSAAAIMDDVNAQYPLMMTDYYDVLQYGHPDLEYLAQEFESSMDEELMNAAMMKLMEYMMDPDVMEAFQQIEGMDF